MNSEKEKKEETAYDGDITQILYSASDIEKACKRLGAAISNDYKKYIDKGEGLVIVGLLRGAFMFQADLVRYITVRHEIDFMMLGSYSGTQSHNVNISCDMRIDPYKKHILIVEDLIDTGATLAWLQQHLKTKKSLSVTLCTLLDKQTKNRVKNVDIKYVGFQCPDYWIVGYGMDYNQHYRSLPYIGVLDPKIYESEKK